MRREIRRMRREQERAEAEAQELASRISQISTFRSQLDSVCESDADRLVARENGGYNIWVAHCGGLPDYRVTFSQDNSEMFIQAYDWDNLVTLRGADLQNALHVVRREGFECCAHEPI